MMTDRCIKFCCRLLHQMARDQDQAVFDRKQAIRDDLEVFMKQL